MSLKTRASTVLLRFVNEATGTPLTLLYADESAPQWDDDAQKWLILGHAQVDGENVSTIAVLLPELSAARFDGDDTKHGCVLGAAVGTSRWTPSDPSTAWSSNRGGSCEVELRAAARPGHLEGSIRGKLFANSGRDYFVVSAGYVYVAR